MVCIGFLLQNHQPFPNKRLRPFSQTTLLLNYTHNMNTFTLSNNNTILRVCSVLTGPTAVLSWTHLLFSTDHHSLVSKFCFLQNPFANQDFVHKYHFPGLEKSTLGNIPKVFKTVQTMSPYIYRNPLPTENYHLLQHHPPTTNVPNPPSPPNISPLPNYPPPHTHTNYHLLPTSISSLNYHLPPDLSRNMTVLAAYNTLINRLYTSTPHRQPPPNSTIHINAMYDAFIHVLNVCRRCRRWHCGRYYLCEHLVTLRRSSR